MAGGHLMQREEAKAVAMLPGITRRTIARSAEAMVVEFTLEAGAVMDTHHHPHHQSGYLVSGEIVMTIDEVEHPCQAGASWSIPGGVPHSVRVIEPSIVIDFFSPPREDYQD